MGGVGAEPIKCVRAYARYLCHLDNPEKAQYSINDVICCCGADYYSLIQSSSDKYSAIGEIIDFCELEDIVSYAELIIYARENNFEWFKILCDSGTLPIVQFLKSRHWEINNHLKRKGVLKKVKMMKKQIPLEKKIALTLEESAALTNIGVNKLRELYMPNCDFVLFVGNKRLLKRKELERYLSKAYSI